MAWLGTLGTAVVEAANTVGSVTVGQAVPVGAFVALTVAWSNDVASVPTINSVADSRSNTYTTQASAGAANTTVSCAIITAPVTTALQASDTITVTIAANRIRWALQADAFGSVGAVDKTAANDNPGSSASMSTGTTAATTYASELVIACYGFGRGGGATSSLDAGWSGGSYVTTAAGSSDRALQMGFKYVQATGTQQGTATLSLAAVYAGAIASFTSLFAPLPVNPVRRRAHLLVR